MFEAPRMLLALLAISMTSCGAWLLWRQTKRWRRQASLRNIPGPPSKSFLTGHIGQIHAPQSWQFHADIVATYGKVVKLNGFLGDAVLYISDTRALQSILIRDQHAFSPLPVSVEGNKLIFGPGLVSTLGDHHKRQRKLLNPFFSVNQMRYMMPIFVQVAQQLREILVQKAKENGDGVELDFLDWMSRASLETIGQAGFGYSFGDLNNEVENVYAKAVKHLAPTLSSPQVMLGAQAFPWILKVGTPNLRGFVAKYLPWKSMQTLVHIADVMNRTAQNVFESKRSALKLGDEAVLQQVGDGKDILSALLIANTNASADNGLPDSEVVAHMSVMLFGGMETTSSALSRTLHLLSGHQDVQKKLRDELAKANSDGELDFDALYALPYLDAVIKETLRLYPPAQFVWRMTCEDSTVPLATPIIGTDGQSLSDIVIPKDTGIILGYMGVNRDRDIWGPDAMEWKPERWLSPLPSSVTEAHVPGVYANTTTFGGGIHSCIGFKFSELEMKIILASLLPSLRFSASDKDISWTMGGISVPKVDGSSQPTMPLVLSLLRGDDA